MIVMERSEPTLVPQWLRNNGGGTGSGISRYHIASSDDASLALQKQNRTSRSFNNTNGPYSSYVDRKTGTTSRRSLSYNASNKHDKHFHARTYSSNYRNQRIDREKLDVDTWDSEFSDSVTSLMVERFQNGYLRRSQSMNLRRPRELSNSQHKLDTDLRNKNHNINANGNANGVVFVANDTAGPNKVPLERNFPVLGSDERPPTPEFARVLSPTLSRGVHDMSIGTKAANSSEGRTSGFTEVSNVAGRSSIASPPAMEPLPSAVVVATSPSASMSNAATAPNGLNLAGALEQSPPRPQSGHQAAQTQRFEELPFVGSKRLIPMTPSSPKTLVLNPSDMLKPKAAMKSNEAVPGLNNGLQQTSLQLCSQQVRGSVKSDGPKSFSSGKLLLLNRARENDLSSQVVNMQSVIPNGQSTCSSVAFVPSKIRQNVKLVDKKCSPSPTQLQSRNDFFNMVRRKSMSNTSVAADSGTVDSCNDQSSDEPKETASGRLAPPTQSGTQVKCNGDDVSNAGATYTNAKEEAFLRSLGWDDSAGDEDGLTEEEINSFVQKLKIMTQSDHLKWKSASKSWQSLQLKISAQSDPQVTCSAGVSSEVSS